ncbi:hypothetical protein [Aestuariicoccus sp. MJ-SS9]|uniref:hypothetical protein n=1 Tax=Aestuariicoccus sp. MJ-SS9 TaxID=3079855 RepID=UPI0029317684|nr:hypothetical protein [Aestuariicoccus sp. MJ-SS9]
MDFFFCPCEAYVKKSSRHLISQVSFSRTNRLSMPGIATMFAGTAGLTWIL